MFKTIAIILAFALFGFAPPKAFAAPSADEDTAVLHLISFVRESQQQFIRNGSVYEAGEAADHLAMKYAQAKNYISTADDFIDKVASKSSMTGQIYIIRHKDGTEEPVGDWLHAELKKYRDTQKKP